MEKIYKCEFCGTNATVTNSRGGCVSCGATIKRENIEIVQEEFGAKGYSYDEYGKKTGAWGVCSASAIDFGRYSSGSLTNLW